MIESPQNDRVKYWKKLQTSASHRRKEKLFLVEGWHLLEEANKHAFLKEVIYCGDENASKLPENVPAIKATKKVIEAISDTKTPQPVIGICGIKELPELSKISEHHLILDRIQDPGNIGTMIRSASAAGWGSVILGDGCADVYSPKVIRGTQGALFHLPLYQRPLIELINKLGEKDINIIGTDNTHEAADYRSCFLPSQSALVVGNEGSGISDEVRGLCDFFVRIPIHPRVESLSVATATSILLMHWSVI